LKALTDDLKTAKQSVLDGAGKINQFPVDSYLFRYWYAIALKLFLESPENETGLTFSDLQTVISNISTDTSELFPSSDDPKKVTDKPPVISDKKFQRFFICYLTTEPTLHCKLNKTTSFKWITQKQSLKTINDSVSSIKIAKNNLLPEFNVKAGLGYDGLGGNYGNAYDDQYTGRHPDWSVGLEVSFPLFYNEPVATYRRAKYNKKQAKLTMPSHLTALKKLPSPTTTNSARPKTTSASHSGSNLSHHHQTAHTPLSQKQTNKTGNGKSDSAKTHQDSCRNS